MTSETSSTAVTAELSPAHRLQDLINELSVEFISILDLDELIERIALRLREVIDFKFFNLLLSDEERNCLVWKKSIGYKPEEVARHRYIPLDRSLASAAWRHGHTLIIPDVQQDPRYMRLDIEGNDEPRGMIAVPLKLIREQKVVGVLAIESVEPNYFTPEHERILNVLGNQLAVALENARLYDELRARTDEMETLIDIGHEINSILDLDKLLDHITPLLHRVIAFDTLSVGLIDDETEEFVWHIEEGFNAPSESQANRTGITQGIVGRAVQHRHPVIVGDVSHDPSYHVSKGWEECSHHSEMAVPLIHKDKVIGVIALESRRTNAFGHNHAHLLQSVANNLSIAIANARLYAEQVEREQLLENEILLARDIQRAMIPDTPPNLKRFEIAARLEPALNLSGDFYDYIRLAEHKFGIMIGDVAGKGVRAAMGMAAARSITRLVARSGFGLAKMMKATNSRLHRDLARQLLVTMVYGVLNTEARTFQYSNAGHNPPILMKPDGRWRALKTGGLMLGIFDQQQYKSETIHLQKGDVLFFYTDGLSEAHTAAPDKQEFGERRIVEVIREHRNQKASVIADAVLKAVTEFSADAHQHDDLTLIVIKAV
jgi:sigma-B regulation protein RsbU (phosphoserine phosphatase)